MRFALLLFLCSSVYSTETRRDIKKLVKQVERALTPYKKSYNKSFESEDPLYFHSFEIYIKPRVIIKFASLVSLRIVPSIGLIWGRTLPPGYDLYKPREKRK